MQISVIGCGYLGAVHAATMASIGHSVVAIDISEEKVASLSNGVAPIYEPGLSALLVNGISSGRLQFGTKMEAVRDAEVHFLAVGTPQRHDGQGADLQYLYSAIDELLPFVAEGSVVVGKSTVPVGTAADLEERVAARGATLLWNPEFLREGLAVKDTLSPDRIVVGASDAVRSAPVIQKLQNLYAASGNEPPFIVTNFETAELVKGAANAFLATKISFINAMAEVAETAGADVTKLAEALGHDERIGRRFLGAGIGFGGGCLPKDIRAFAARAEELGCGDSVRFLHEIDAINLRRRDRAAELVIEALGGSVAGRRVTVLGAAFKSGSDDVRDSPALAAAAKLHEQGAQVVVSDPKALANAEQLFPELSYEEDFLTAIQGADALLLATDWSEYREPNVASVAAGLVNQRIIVDGRNCLDPELWRNEAWRYIGMGRP